MSKEGIKMDGPGLGASYAERIRVLRVYSPA